MSITRTEIVDTPPVDVNPIPAPISEPLDNIEPPPLPPEDAGVVGDFIPLESNGFDLVSTADSVGAFIPLLIAAGGLVILVAIAALLVRARIAAGTERRDATRSALGTLAVPMVALAALGVLGTSVMLALGTSTSTSTNGLPEWAAATYTIEISDEQAERLVDGEAIGVEYLGSRVLIEGAVGVDGKLYLFNQFGNELPASPDLFGIAPGPPTK